MFSSNLKPDTIDNIHKLLDLEKYNGRVNLIQPPDMNIQFKMFEKITLKNVPTDYREALNGNLEDNVLAQVFFCPENMKIIQNGMKAEVYKLSDGKYIIPNQNVNNLKIIMRSVYLQYAENYVNNITQQVERLNRIVLDYCVPNVFNSAVSYEKYCSDQSSLVVPISHPGKIDREYKQLELKEWI